MEVSFPTDPDGFLSQECRSCGQRFKVVFGGGSKQPISHCPYCGFNGKDCWYTQGQIEYMQAAAANVVLAPELAKFERQLKQMSNGFIKIDVKCDLPSPPPAPIEADDALDMMRFQCCNETVKVARQDRYFCIICGSEIEMAISDSKSVFLSHKGVDKELVVDFKKSLELLGYSAWLDDDAMPAGTSLERGLLQGMQKSCGVVFFITPSFKDEGYLETEINYAIREKRSKGERFAIVTLQFVGSDGQTVEIPQLLRTYVWKKPRTPLEALREIVRALPLAPGIVDWRDGISGVVKVPTAKSTSTELSEEAKAILKEAVSGNGSIIYVRYLGGENMQAGGKSLIPDADPRTVARWVGGLEDLQRRRYIKDSGHKGEVFEVTREGYEVVDKLYASLADE